MPQLLQFEVLVRVGGPEFKYDYCGGPQFKYDYFGGLRPEKVENHVSTFLFPCLSCVSYFTAVTAIDNGISACLIKSCIPKETVSSCFFISANQKKGIQDRWALGTSGHLDVKLACIGKYYWKVLNS